MRGWRVQTTGREYEEGEVGDCSTAVAMAQVLLVVETCTAEVAEGTQPKTQSRFDDLNVRKTVQNYSIGTFSWGSPFVHRDVLCLPYSLNRHVTPCNPSVGSRP